jgi:hypothetical protein
MPYSGLILGEQSQHLISVFAEAVCFLEQLQRLLPGECLEARREDMRDFYVPPTLLDRQTPEHLAEWFRSRAPFRCTALEDVSTRKWTFCRPKNRPQPRPLGLSTA